MNDTPSVWSAASPPRTIAARIVAQWLQTADFPDRMLGGAPARAFVTECVYGTVRRFRTLEWVLDSMSRIPAEPALKSVLLVALYELLFMRQDADHGVVNHAVEQIKQDRTGSPKFANAILRRVARERKELFAALQAQGIGIRESHPDFLVEGWTAAYGQAETERICEWNNGTPDTILRSLGCDHAADEWIRSVRDAGIALTEHPFDPKRYYSLPHGLAPTEVPGYDSGAFIVQDPACSVPVDLLRVAPGHDVLDACAAPGGKMAVMAAALSGTGRITACDIHADRLETLRSTVQRLKLTVVEVCRDNALRPHHAPASFDRILLDVPCSNTGVLRRRVDARWRVSSDRIRRMVRTQYALLDAAESLLKAGGRLVYSTCSVEREENEELIARWLQSHPDWTCVEQRLMLPGQYGTDGAFAAALERK